MATSGRGSGVVGYNVQTAVDTKHHLIVTHEVTNVGTDRSQLASVAKQTKDTLYDGPPFDDGNHLAHGVHLAISTKESGDYTAIVSAEVTWPNGQLGIFV
jgi:hypothetical protein